MKSFSKLLGKKVSDYICKQLKEEQKQDKKRIKERVKEHNQQEINHTYKVLDENIDCLSDENIKNLKYMVDLELDGEKKVEDLSRKQTIRKLKNRLRNKKFIFEDHRKVRNEIEKMTQVNLYNIQMTSEISEDVIISKSKTQEL